MGKNPGTVSFIGWVWAIEQTFYAVWCYCTLQTNIWCASVDANLVNVEEPTVTRIQLVSAARTNQGRRLSSGEISGGEAL